MDIEFNTDEKPDCVVIDTNIWRSQLLLKTPLGMSLVYTLGRQQGFIGLPEVVERELTRQIQEAGSEAADALTKSSRIISTLTDSPFHAPIPTETELEEKVAARLVELDPILVRVPFTLEHSKAALDMVNAKVPPNSEKNQQFKDSAIWQAVLAISSEYSVHLLTNDKAFLLNRDHPSKGLAKNLKQDCDNLAVNVGIYCELGSCLKAIRRDEPTFDHARLRSLIEPPIMPRLRAEATRNRILIGDTLNTDITAFRMAKTNRLAVDYTITTRCEEDPSRPMPGYTDLRVITYGSCYYDPAADSLSGNFIERIAFKWNSERGGWSRSARSFENEDPLIPFPRPIEWS